MEIRKDNLLISDDKTKINRKKVYQLLQNSYWASKRSRQTIDISIENSKCFGLYQDNKIIGFTRALTDKTVSSWRYDIIIEKQYRGRGLGKWFFDNIIKHKDLMNIKIYLTTRDAQGLYKKYGFRVKEAMVKIPDQNC